MYARKMTALLATDEGASLPDSLRQQCFVDLAAASNKASARPPARAVLLDPAWATVTAHTVACPALLAHGPHSLARSWSTVEVGPLRLSASKQRAMAAIGVALSWHSGPAVTTTLGASSLLGNLHLKNFSVQVALLLNSCICCWSKDYLLSGRSGI